MAQLFVIKKWAKQARYYSLHSPNQAMYQMITINSINTSITNSFGDSGNQSRDQLAAAGGEAAVRAAVATLKTQQSRPPSDTTNSVKY